VPRSAPCRPVHRTHARKPIHIYIGHLRSRARCKHRGYDESEIREHVKNCFGGLGVRVGWIPRASSQTRHPIGGSRATRIQRTRIRMATAGIACSTSPRQLIHVRFSLLPLARFEPAEGLRFQKCFHFNFPTPHYWQDKLQATATRGITSLSGRAPKETKILLTLPSGRTGAANC
jgi:hypothetical protein